MTKETCGTGYVYRDRCVNARRDRNSRSDCASRGQRADERTNERAEDACSAPFIGHNHCTNRSGL